MSIDYAIIVKNKTRLEALIERFNTKAQAQFYIERQGGDFKDYELEHEVFHRSLSMVQAELSKVIKHKLLERMYVPSFLFSDKNVIIVVGQDGLVANVAKYANGVPIVAVNPDKKRYDGVLLPFDSADFIKAVSQVMAGTHKSRQMQFAEALLNDGQRLLAFNDLFIGASSHVSARYRITYGNSKEEQSSSGMIVSTAAGATGWLSSMFNMAYGVAGMFEKNLTPKHAKVRNNELFFVVREPFRSIRTQTTIIAGIIQNKQALTIESLMPTGGIIFSDGVESDFIKFNSGAIATIGLASEIANLVVKA